MGDGWRLYLDECVEKSVTRDLKAAGFDVESAHSLRRRSESDGSHLEFAAQERRTLLTYDTDFVHESAALLSQGQHHSGVLLSPNKHDLGRLIRSVKHSLERWSPHELRDQVRWLLRAE